MRVFTRVRWWCGLIGIAPIVFRWLAVPEAIGARSRYAPKVRSAAPEHARRGSGARARAGPAACLEGAPSRELAHAKRSSTYEERAAGREANVQPRTANRNSLALRRSGRASVVVPTFFRSAARGLHAPGDLTPELTKHEARKRRADERPRVGCCEEL